ncbi:MAG: hypothetical protein EOO24_29385, partial [Comamonadaceae bacterium]
MNRPSLCIVTPALADANNGNWQTASRWSQMLREHYRVTLVDHWDGTPADAMVALHARRSAAAIERWADTRPRRPVVQQHQAVGVHQRTLGAQVGGDVAVQVGAGQHHRDRAARPGRGPALDRGCRAARMQRHHRVGRRAVPVVDQRDTVVLAQHLRPSRCRLPVAVVGIGQRRRHDAERRA